METKSIFFEKPGKLTKFSVMQKMLSRS